MNDIAAPMLSVGAMDRQKYLGGSDAAAIFGVSPWKTPVDLFLDKIKPRSEQPEDPARVKFFARRKRQEPVIAEMLADEYGIVVTTLSLDDNPNRYRDEEYPFLAAEIDFEFRMSESVREHFPDRPEFCAIPNGTLLNGEIKTVHPFKASEWGEQGSEDVPIHYAAQVMHGLGVTKRPAALVAALFGLDTLLCFPVMADPDLIVPMRAQCVKFWTEHVLTSTPPAPVNLDDVKRLYTGFAGKPCYLSDEAAGALRSLDALRKQAQTVKADQEECEWLVAKFIADAWGMPIIDKDGKPEVSTTDNAVLLVGDTEVGKWARQRGTYLDQKRLKQEQPEILGKYTVEHHYRAFRLKKAKG